MKPNSRLSTTLAVLLTVATLLGCVLVSPAPAAAQQAPADWDIPGGHFFTQTGTGHQTGLRHHRRQRRGLLERVQAPGRRQRPRLPRLAAASSGTASSARRCSGSSSSGSKDANSVSFVNVFDLMHDNGKDAWLESVRQTPKPKAFNEQGLGWEQIVQQRLAVLDANPAIKQAYLAVSGDPVTMNGLPTTDVVDMGNNYIVRAQRVVIQQWKEDVPWAKAGQVTFGLGGSIAMEAGLLPAQSAGDPEIILVNNDKKFRVGYPYNWRTSDYEGWTVVLESNSVENNVRAGIAIDIGPEEAFPLELMAAALNSQNARDELQKNSKLNDFFVEVPKIINFGDRAFVKQVYGGTTQNGNRVKDVRYAFFIGNVLYWFSGVASEVFLPQARGNIRLGRVHGPTAAVVLRRLGRATGGPAPDACFLYLRPPFPRG